MAAAAEHMSYTAIDNLPDEVLTDVLLRVPTPAALVHAAAVSKRWRGLIAFPTPTGRFLKDYRARHSSSPLLGLYIPRESGGLPSFQKADSIQSADGDDDLQRAAAKAFSLRGLESNRDWRLLDCYNGRLLLARGHDSLEEYNPLSCEHISVPLPQHDMLLDYFSMCLLQGRCNKSLRVVSVQHRRHGRGQKLHAVEYDSQRQSWNHHLDWDTLKNIEIEGNEQGKVMHAGNLIFCKYNCTSLLLLDTRKMQFSVLPLPYHINPKSYAIGEMEDGVCCLAAVDSVGKLNTLHLRVWRLEKLEWKLEKEMQVRKVLGEHAPRGHSYYRVRKVTNGLALLGWSNGDLYFIIDLKTFCVMEKFEFSRHVHAFPMQMPWPPTFSVVAVHGDDSQPELKLGDGGASKDCMPSKTPENLGVQDATVASVSTPAGEECFRKEINVPDDYDLQALIQDATVASVSTPAGEECFRKEINVADDCDLQALTTDLCDQVSDLMHPEGTRPHHLERREPMVGLEQCVHCPIAVTKDSEVNSSNVVQLNQSPSPFRCSKRARATTLDLIPEDDEAEEAPVPSSSRRQKKSGEHGDALPPLPDHLRCARSDGKKWRCSAKALPTVTFCEYHYTKANKGKKLPVDGKVLAVVLQRQKNKRKGRKSIDPPVSPQATTTDNQNRDILNGLMTAKGDAVEESPLHGRHHRQKLGGCGDPLPDHLRCIRSDGKKWRCSGRALSTIRFCEYHYAKANKGKKMPADGEVLAVAQQMLKNKRKGRKSINPPASPQATTGDRQNRDLLNGSMTIKGDAVESAPPSPPHGHCHVQKLEERGDPLPPLSDHLRCARNDGKKWRCSGCALPTVSFCEYHYAKANKGKKVPADGEVLVVALQRLKNKRKDRKSINPLASHQEPSSDRQNKDLPNGPMTTEGDAVESPRPSPPHGRCRLQKLGEHGDPLPPLPDHLRCAHNDGKKWRCSGLALPTVSFCEYHYAKANKGKKLPADAEVLAVALQRLKNKRKGSKSINSPALPQATTSACQTGSPERTCSTVIACEGCSSYHEYDKGSTNYQEHVTAAV